MSSTTNRAAALAAIVVGLGAGSYGIASAASGSGSTSTAASTTPTAAAALSVSRSTGATRSATASTPWGHQRSDEKLLTGDALAKVQAIAKSNVPGGNDRPGRNRRRRGRDLRSPHDQSRRLADHGLRRQQLPVRQHQVDRLSTAQGGRPATAAGHTASDAQFGDVTAITTRSRCASRPAGASAE